MRHSFLRRIWFIGPLFALSACGSQETGPVSPSPTSSDVSPTASGVPSSGPTSSVTATSSAPVGASSSATTSGPTSLSVSTSSSSEPATTSTSNGDTSTFVQTQTESSTSSESGPSPSSEAPTSSTAEETSASVSDTEPSGDWSPCKENPCKVLPLGDSITFGLTFEGGYRIELFRLAHSNQLGLTFVGSQNNGPDMVDGAAFPKAHEGFSGWTIQQIYDRMFSTAMPSAAMAAEPEIVLLHIGTNDMYQSPNGAPDRLATLIDDLTERLPESLIVVSTIIPFPQGAAAVTTYNTALVSVVNERIDAGKHVAFVDQFEGFPTSELGDGVHPNQQGYARMGAKWYEAISQYLPPAE